MEALTGGDPAAIARFAQEIIDAGTQYYRQQKLAIKEGRMDFNTHLTKTECSKKGLHCWTTPIQRFGSGGTGGWHEQSCVLCGATGRRNGKRKRTELVDGADMCLSKARKAKNAVRRCVKIICLIKWWTKATYAPPSSGGAGYHRLRQEAVARGMTL